MIELKIVYPPVPWKAHGGYGAKSYNRNQRHLDFYQAHWKELYKYEPIHLPIRCEYEFGMQAPDTLRKQKREAFLSEPHTKRPDLSNLVKFVEDTLKKIVIHDDSFVTSLSARKIYSLEPYTIVKIFPI